MKSTYLAHSAARQRGNAILQAIGVLGVIGIIAVATLKLANNNKRAGEGSLQYGDAKRFFGMLNMLFRNEASCRLALGGPATYPGTASGFTEAVMGSGSFFARFISGAGDNFGWLMGERTAFARHIIGPPALPVSILQAYDTQHVKIYDNNTAAGQSLVYSDASGTNMVGRLTISSMTFTPGALYASPPAVPNNIYLDSLNITLSKSTGLLGAGNVSLPTLQLAVMVDGSNNIISCTSEFQGSGPSPFPICSAGQALRSDGTQATCVQAICPASSPLPVTSPSPSSGVAQTDASGNILCQ